MKVNCLACQKAIRIHEDHWIEHQPPKRLAWLTTREGVCIGAGLSIYGEEAVEKIEEYCQGFIENCVEDLATYRADKETIMVEVKYAACEDPDKPVGKFWEGFSTDEIIEKSIGAGVTNYFVAPRHDPSNLVKIGSESALLAGGKIRTVEQKKRDYAQHLEKKITHIGNFFKR